MVRRNPCRTALGTAVADRRAELDVQISLYAEAETMKLGWFRQIVDRLNATAAEEQGLPLVEFKR